MLLGIVWINSDHHSHSADAFPRVAPIRAAESLHSQPPQHLHCPLYRPDSSSFAASLRELEKVGGARLTAYPLPLPTALPRLSGRRGVFCHPVDSANTV